MIGGVTLTLVLGLELPVARSGPGGHGPGAEVRVLPGLRGQLQTHGADVALPDGDHVTGQTHSTPAGGATEFGLYQLLLWREEVPS